MRCLGGRNPLGLVGCRELIGGGGGAVPLDQREADGGEVARLEGEGWANPEGGWCGRGGGDGG